MAMTGSSSSIGNMFSGKDIDSGEQPAIREMLWPPSGYVFEQEFMLPAYCKPKICPLKSVTLEKLEKMQAEAGQKLKELQKLERHEKAEMGQKEEVQKI
jgi:BBSome-interacting protein 1